MTVYENVSELYNEKSQNLFWWLQGSFRCSKKKLSNKSDPINLFLETNDYDVWYGNEESPDATRICDMKRICRLIWHATTEIWGKRSKSLSKLLTRLPILLAQIDAGQKFEKIKKWNQANTTSFVSA